MLQIKRLRCEYLTDPVGIEVVQPRLSWELGFGLPERRGSRQSAYRIVVRKSDGGIAWDSGKVSSAQTAQIAYQGKNLHAGTEYRWKVRVWDDKGVASCRGPGEGLPTCYRRHWSRSQVPEVKSTHGAQKL